MNEISPKNLEIINYEIQSGNLFSSDYIIYTINVKAFDWLVYRKVSDFHWLADSLKEKFPGCLVIEIQTYQFN